MKKTNNDPLTATTQKWRYRAPQKQLWLMKNRSPHKIFC